MMKTTRWGWGGRNPVLLVMGLNVALAGVLAFLTAVIDVVPYDLGMLLYRVNVQLSGALEFGLLLGALTFLPWLHVTYARALEVAPTPELQLEKKRGPIIGFFIPIANLFRPYAAVRVLDEALDPNRVPLPTIRKFDPAAGYREPAALAIPELRSRPSAPVALWWGLWIGRTVFNAASSMSHTTSNAAVAANNAVTCAAGVAALLVVWRIAARLDEVERRRASFDEAESVSGREQVSG